MSAQTARGVLLAAADQGRLWPGEGSYVPGDPCCAYGHINVASGEDLAVQVAAIQAFSAYVSSKYGGAGCVWSDRPDRTAAEVSAALRAAAGRAEA